MNKSLVSLAGLVAMIGACSSQKSVTEDVLAQDSTLALAVMSANRDSIASFADDSIGSAAQSRPIGGARSAEAQPPQPRRATTPRAAVTMRPQPVSVAAVPRPVKSKPRTVASASVSRADRPSARTGPRRSARKTRRTDSRIGSSHKNQAAVLASAVISPRRGVPQESRAPLRATALIPAGSTIALTSDARVCSSSSTVGDTFTARVAEDVVGPLGIVIPGGSVATAEVFTKQNTSRTNSASDVGIRIQSVTISGRTYPIESLVTSSDVTRIRRPRNDAAKVVGGAGVGAILGRVIGRDTRSTVIGAVGGAAAGAVLARQTGKMESCIPDGGRITAQLTAPLRVALSE